MTKEEAIFAEALGKGSPAERRAHVEHACGGDAQLLRAVESLLVAHDQATGILESPPPHLDFTGDPRPPGEGIGSTVGPYKLLEQIGGGGMGVVYMAEQLHPVRRKVALKIIKPGMDSGHVIARFEAERQALTMMDHPNIAKVLDAGTTDMGRPYFVMELVKGMPITAYCDQARVPMRERLELFVTVCHAVQHAHQKGVIHRDLKPSNVLVTLHDDKPVPKVIDFGIAKAVGQQLTERTLFTNYAQMLGTPLYMSPEQAQLSGLDVDTRSDVYSLGVLLYELLTGTTPFDKQRLRDAAYDEMRRIIREEDPPKPSTRISTMGEQITLISTHRHTDPKHLGQLVHGDLDWIVMKAMEKDRTRRYETANGLARDVERHLRDEPVQACSPSGLYRFHKFARRNKVALAVSGMALFFLVLLGSGMGWAVRDRSAREEQLAHERQARQARVSAQLELILDEVARLEQAEKWIEALASARRAETALAAGDAPPEIQNRVRQALADLVLVQRLDDIRAQSGTVWGLSHTHEIARNPLAVRAEPDYAAAFRKAGIDIDTLSVDEAVKRITARRHIAAAIVPALDDWVAVRSKGKDKAATRRLIEVLRVADPDPWRQRVRNCLERKDWSALVDLARTPDLDRQPAATISFLCAALRQQAESDIARTDGGGPGGLGHWGFLLEIEVLRRAQFNYPADYWINHRLGMSLIWLKTPPLVQDGMGYLRTAVALRPQQAEVMMNLGHGHLFIREYDQAIACYRKAFELAPKDGPLQHQLAWHLTACKARQRYGKAIHNEERPDDEKVSHSPTEAEGFLKVTEERPTTKPAETEVK